jgi:hypothetical protein
VLAPALVAGVKVQVDSDKTFDFKSARTWAWNPAGAGDVIMARTPEDDPDAMQKRAEPVIVEAVAAEMNRLGLQTAASQADLTITYYLLLSTGTSAQSMGQFLPTNAQWGIPYFPPSTSSLTVMNAGSLVLDMSANGAVVWRGVAHAQITPGAPEEKRTKLLREAVRDLLKKYPPKR